MKNVGKGEARQRIKKLREEIEHHRYLYHVLDRQEISDAALDSLKEELKNLEEAFPEFRTPDSPTMRVGGQPRKEFQRVRHEVPMLSLDDAFSFEELKQWEKRNIRLLDGKKWTYFCELKVDGLAIELTYEKGMLVRGSTRGDGVFGEDVTENVKTIETIPLRLRGDKAPARLVVRGEVYMEKSEFERLNTIQQKEGKALYANPRNVAAGSVRQLDSRITAKRPLKYMAYDITHGISISTHEEGHTHASNFGFVVDRHAMACGSLHEVQQYVERMAKKREKIPYWVDGIVVTINEQDTFQKLGVRGKSPRGSIAYKFPAEEATTVIHRIIVQVGRTGALTPVAVLEPVVVAGTVVSRATLHNENEIHRKDIRAGDTVIIRKAGDIIPEVVRVLPRLRKSHAPVFHMPKQCPICGGNVAREEGGAIHRCTNTKCAAIQREGIEHFVSRNGADIEGVGPKLVEKLLEAGVIRNAADLYALSTEDIVSLERYADTSAGNIVTSIQERKNLPLDRLLYAIGIPHVGTVTARDLAEHFRSLDAIRTADVEALSEIEGIGSVVAEHIVRFFRSSQTKLLLHRFQELGVTVENMEPRNRRGPFTGEVVVVTGSLGKITREEAWERIQALGGRVAKSVGKHTTLLVAGDDPGSKLREAQKRGIRIMEKEAFWRVVGVS